jgi:hypothetical protein
MALHWLVDTTAAAAAHAKLGVRPVRWCTTIEIDSHCPDNFLIIAAQQRDRNIVYAIYEHVNSHHVWLCPDAFTSDSVDANTRKRRADQVSSNQHRMLDRIALPPDEACAADYPLQSPVTFYISFHPKKRSDVPLRSRVLLVNILEALRRDECETLATLCAGVQRVITERNATLRQLEYAQCDSTLCVLEINHAQRLHMPMLVTKAENRAIPGPLILFHEVVDELEEEAAAAACSYARDELQSDNNNAQECSSDDSI